MASNFPTINFHAQAGQLVTTTTAGRPSVGGRFCRHGGHAAGCSCAASVVSSGNAPPLPSVSENLGWPVGVKTSGEKLSPTQVPFWYNILLMAEILHQLRLLAYPIIDKVSYIPGGCLGFLPSTVAIRSCPPFSIENTSSKGPFSMWVYRSVDKTCWSFSSNG